MSRCSDIAGHSRSHPAVGQRRSGTKGPPSAVQCGWHLSIISDKLTTIKGAVQPEIKFDPFITHHTVNQSPKRWHFLIYETIPEFYRQKEFQAVSERQDYKARHGIKRVIVLLWRDYSSVWKWQQSSFAQKNCINLPPGWSIKLPHCCGELLQHLLSHLISRYQTSVTFQCLPALYNWNHLNAGGFRPGSHIFACPFSLHLQTNWTTP